MFCFTRDQVSLKNPLITNFSHLKFFGDNFIHKPFFKFQHYHNVSDVHSTIRDKNTFALSEVRERGYPACRWTSSALFVINVLFSVFEGFVLHKHLTIEQKIITITFSQHKSFSVPKLFSFTQNVMAYLWSTVCFILKILHVS